jgi:hypothetical protein
MCKVTIFDLFIEEIKKEKYSNTTDNRYFEFNATYNDIAIFLPTLLKVYGKKYYSLLNYIELENKIDKIINDVNKIQKDPITIYNKVLIEKMIYPLIITAKKQVINNHRKK